MSNVKRGGCLGKGLLILLAIVFFPIAITVLIFKSKMSTKAKLISVAALWAVVLIIGAISPSTKHKPVTDDRSIVVQDEASDQEQFAASETTSTSETTTFTETSETTTSAETSEAATETTTTQTETTVVTTTTTTEPVVTFDTELGINYPRPTGTPELTVGSSGDEVCWLQEALNKTMGCNIAVDGSYGDEMASAVKEFQERCDLAANGIADPMTINTLVDILSGNKKLPDPPVVETEPPATEPPTEPPVVTQAPEQNNSRSYVLNNNTYKFHDPSCSSVDKIKDENREDYTGSRDELIAQGYSPCNKCNP